MTTVVTSAMIEAGVREAMDTTHCSYAQMCKAIYLAMSTASQPKGLRIEPADPVKLEDPEGIYSASQPPAGTVPYSDDHLGIDQPSAEDAVERAWAAFVAEGQRMNREEAPNAPDIEIDEDGAKIGKRLLRAAIQALSKDEAREKALSHKEQTDDNR